MKATNFKSNVPENIIEKLKLLAETAEGDFDWLFPNSETYGCLRIDAIEGNYQSGWIPHQDGGFKVSDFCQCGGDSSYHETDKQTAFVDEQAKACYEAFKSDNDIESEEIPESMLEEFYEYEQEWEEPALVEFQCYINGNEVRVERYINYKDAPYYREKYGETITAISFTVEEFGLKDVESIIKELVK